MDNWTLTLHLLLLFSARSCFARGSVFDSPSDELREFPCPLAADIEPCICTPDENYQLFMDCSDVKNDGELAKAFTATFPFTTFRTLKIDQLDPIYDSHELNALTQVSFGPVSFEHVEIRGTTLTAVEEGAFANSHGTLISLKLQTNEISSFTFEVIGEFTKLTTLLLSANKFDGIPIQPISSASLEILNLNDNPWVNVRGDFVKGCPALEQLLMRNTGQTSVPLLEESPISMIDGLEHIKIVNFAENSISTLQAHTFNTGLTPNTITEIHLSKNYISTVFPSFVTGLVNDAETLIDLSKNSIQFLDEKVWADTFKNIGDGIVNMAENPLVCGCDIEWFVTATPEIQAVLDPATKCYTGDLVSDLPAEAFDQCP